MGKPKLPERLITHRFFRRKNKDPDSYAYMKAGGHKKLYAESVLTLNEAAAAKRGDTGPYLMPMCLPVSLGQIQAEIATENAGLWFRGGGGGEGEGGVATMC